MTLEKALNTAIEYETRIHAVYAEASQKTTDAVGQRILSALAEDEQHHIDYLTHKLAQWKKEGAITADKLASDIPNRQDLSAEVAQMDTDLTGKDLRDHKQVLSKALRLEIETSDFYRRLTQEMPDEHKALFARFREIENEHIDIVQAELDYLSKSGYWFGEKEFDME
jgi:rubrerythrin